MKENEIIKGLLDQFDAKRVSCPRFVVRWHFAQNPNMEFSILRGGCWVGFGNRADILELYNNNLVINKKDVEQILKINKTGNRPQ